jgi:hypothetical protein
MPPLTDISSRLISKPAPKVGIIIRLIRSISALDSLFRRLARLVIKPRWERTGKCLRCGECCKLIGIGMEDKMARIAPLRNFVIWWASRFDGFIFQEWDRANEVLLFRCRYFQNNSCSNYKARPQMCRDYPTIHNFFKEPVFFPSCGFKAIQRK